MKKFSPAKIIKEAISPYNQYCDGFKSPGASGKGYITSLILSIGRSHINFNHKGSQILDSIVAFDRAEVNNAYIGQINMTIVSSFCGPNGLIWGYDLARPKDLKTKHPLAPSFVHQRKKKIPVYSAKGLQKASLSLFGSVEKKRFPFLPGAHVPCAGRHFTIKGPKHIYCAVAIGIPEDRSISAALLMEDAGELKERKMEKGVSRILKNIAESIVLIGENQNVKYKEIFVDLKHEKVKKNEIGCILVAMPYFTLAKWAVPKYKSIEKMMLTDWEKATRDKFLDKNP